MVKKKVKKSSEKEDWHTEIRMKTTLKHGKKAKKHGKKNWKVGHSVSTGAAEKNWIVGHSAKPKH